MYASIVKIDSYAGVCRRETDGVRDVWVRVSSFLYI